MTLFVQLLFISFYLFNSFAQLKNRFYCWETSRRVVDFGNCQICLKLGSLINTKEFKFIPSKFLKLSRLVNQFIHSAWESIIFISGVGRQLDGSCKLHFLLLSHAKSLESYEGFGKKSDLQKERRWHSWEWEELFTLVLISLFRIIYFCKHFYDEPSIIERLSKTCWATAADSHPNYFGISHSYWWNLFLTGCATSCVA